MCNSNIYFPVDLRQLTIKHIIIICPLFIDSIEALMFEAGTVLDVLSKLEQVVCVEGLLLKSMNL